MDTVSLHQARDAMPPVSEALGEKFGMNAPMAIDTIDLGMNQPDFAQQLSVCHLSRRRSAV
ncbi:hypothetical protein LHGZ1_3131 [Laribacter hongkongensis]|uniref:Uncharacterized protein n=1 Tax=Laribacter hongkongensis TaxID=168471 RepID=A0A248LMR8_9NEIS|nr:hypothetical protein LHGZ1_3131 [Laribacter hongkongensis]